MITRKSLPRRTFLRGMGTAVALPFLDAMVPGIRRAAAGKPPVRMAFVYVPNGIDMRRTGTPTTKASSASCRASSSRSSRSRTTS